MGFAWEIDGKLRFFVFTVLVFGLSTAAFLFTKVIRVLIKHWKSLAIKIFAFIDVILEGGRSFNLKRGLFKVPQCRRETMFAKLSEVEKVALPTERALASLVGPIISMYLGLGPVVRMRNRSLYAVVNEACYWDQSVALSEEALDEIHLSFLTLMLQSLLGASSQSLPEIPMGKAPFLRVKSIQVLHIGSLNLLYMFWHHLQINRKKSS